MLQELQCLLLGIQTAWLVQITRLWSTKSNVPPFFSITMHDIWLNGLHYFKRSELGCHKYQQTPWPECLPADSFGTWWTLAIFVTVLYSMLMFPYLLFILQCKNVFKVKRNPKEKRLVYCLLQKFSCYGSPSTHWTGVCSFSNLVWLLLKTMHFCSGDIFIQSTLRINSCTKACLST